MRPIRGGGAAALVLTMVACGGESTPVGGSGAPTPTLTSTPSSRTYDDHGVTFAYPEDWHELDPFPPDGVAWSIRVGPEVVHGFVEVIASDFETELGQTQLDAFASNFFRFIENEAMGDRLADDPTLTTVAGVEAVHASFESDELGSEKEAYAFVRGTMAYGVDCFIDAGAPEVRDGCDMVIGSLAFTEGVAS